MCPDVESFDVSIRNRQLLAYISTCTDVLEKLGTGDPTIDCEQDDAKIQQYVDRNIDIESYWLG